MKKMYKKPETETISVQMTTTLCGSQTVGFGNGAGSGAALAPGRHNLNPNAAEYKPGN